MPIHLRSVTLSPLPSTPNASDIEAADRVQVSDLFCAGVPLHFSDSWVAQEKAALAESRVQLRMLDMALGILAGAGIMPLNVAVHEQGGRFEFTLREAGRHVPYAVTYLRNPKAPSELCHLAVHTMAGGRLNAALEPVVQIGGEESGDSDLDGDSACGSRVSSRRGSQASDGASSSAQAAGTRARAGGGASRRILEQAFEKLSERSPAREPRDGSEAQGDVPAVRPGSAHSSHSGSSDFDRCMEEAFDEMARQPPDAVPRSGRPASRLGDDISSSGSGPADGSNDSSTFEKAMEDAFREMEAQPPPDSPRGGATPSSAGVKRPATFAVASPGAKRRRAGPDEVSPSATLVAGTAQAPIDLTRATPAPVARPVPGAHQLQQVKRSPVPAELTKQFDDACNKCMAELFKYFTDEELAGLQRDTAMDHVNLRVVECHAIPKDRELAPEYLQSWMQASAAAISDIEEDDPLFFTRNGKEMSKDLIAFKRTRMGGVTPLEKHPAYDNEISRANSDALKRFQSHYFNKMNVSERDGPAGIRRKAGVSASRKYDFASMVAGWATINNFNLSTTAPFEFEGPDGLKKKFASGSNFRQRRTHSREFFNFLKMEFEERKKAQEEGSQGQGSSSRGG